MRLAHHDAHEVYAEAPGAGTEHRRMWRQAGWMELARSRHSLASQALGGCWPAAMATATS